MVPTVTWSLPWWCWTAEVVARGRCTAVTVWDTLLQRPASGAWKLFTTTRRELKNQFQHHTISKYIVLYISTKAMKKKFLISWSTSRVLWSLVHVHVLHILNYNICHVRPLSSISESISFNNNVHYFTSQKMLWI